MKVSIIIPTYNRCEMLASILPSLIEQVGKRNDTEIIVVDDASTIDYRFRLEADNLWDHLTFIQLPENVGSAIARNIGAQKARGEFLIFIDDDIEVKDDFVDTHLHAHQNEEKLLIIGIQLLSHTANRDSYGRYRTHKDGIYQSLGSETEMKDCSGLTTANLSLKRKDFFNIGSFNTEERDLSCQDYEFGWRARQKGYRILCNSRIRTLHHDINLTIESYLRRQYKFAYSHVRLRRLNPTIIADQNLAEEFAVRGPWSKQDKGIRMAKKVAFRILALASVAQGLRLLAVASHKAHLPDRLAFKIYDLALESHYQRGYQAGLRDFGFLSAKQKAQQ